MPRRLGERVDVQLYSFFNLLALDAVVGERHASAALPLGKDPITTLYEPSWAAGPVRRGAEISPPSAFDSWTVIIIIIIIIIINSNKWEFSQSRKYYETTDHIF